MSTSTSNNLYMLQITGKLSHHSPLLPSGARTMQMEIILVSGAGVTISSIVNTTTTTEMVTWIPVQDTGVHIWSFKVDL